MVKGGVDRSAPLFLRCALRDTEAVCAAERDDSPPCECKVDVSLGPAPSARASAPSRIEQDMTNGMNVEGVSVQSQQTNRLDLVCRASLLALPCADDRVLAVAAVVAAVGSSSTHAQTPNTRIRATL